MSRRLTPTPMRGIGPATFHFEGQSADGEFVSADIDCDESGNLELQWTQPDKEKYIKPGNYTVTEVTQPPGYEKTDKAQHLVLDVEYDSGTQTEVATNSGPLIFEDYMKHKVVVRKASGDGDPLPGAIFPKIKMKVNKPVCLIKYR